MRCPDCAKMVSYDTDTEPDELLLDVDAEGTITGTARLMNSCAECSGELKEGTIEFNDENKDLAKHLETCKEKAGQLTIEEESAERDMRQDKPGRYGKTFYVGRVDYTVTCGCGEEFKGQVEAEIQASHMDELV